jgi:RNA polymerase sigma factor (sigma-70 family)
MYVFNNLKQENNMTTAIASINMYQYNDFYKKNKRALFNFILKMVSDPLTAEELVDDVFIKVFNAMHTFDEKKASFKTWVYNIASNASIDYLRKRKVQTISIDNGYENSDGEVEEFQIASDTSSPLDDLIEGEAKDRVESVLATMSEDKAAILRLCAQGYNYQDIADELGMNLGTVKCYIHKARHKMREAFGMVEEAA